ncbi:hypothetical protein ACFQJ7_08580 [Halovenus rubra]|uniref:Major facilitator superfamily (MFS) profile domain-containing protein n=2 Tax=Halovenus rubra TaxID=869890 RepID=A0ABD5X8A0_9EURY|nr:hypothetical protein [Halovenus rubra]
MLKNLGIVGIFGLVLMLAGVGVAASVNLLLGGAFALIIAGLGLIVYGMVTNLLKSMGMGQMM